MAALDTLANCGHSEIPIAKIKKQPDSVDIAAVQAVLPYGQTAVTVSHGGLDVPKPDGSGATIIANAAVVLSFDMERANGSKGSS